MDGVYKMKKEVPEHFGGGENIDIFGYKTEHFDICRSAVLLFEKLDTADQEETQELIKEAAKPLDEMFGIEKKVVESGSASVEDVSKAADLINVFSMKMGAISERMKQDYERETGFVKIHLEEIVKRLNKGGVEELSEVWSRKAKKKSLSRCDMKKIIREELEIALVNEKDDRCTRIAKRKYDAWPSAYASGAVVRCRAGKIWKDLKEDMTDEELAENQEYEQIEEKDSEGLRKWFGRKGAPGKTGGWVDCNTCRKDKKTGKKKCKPCGRQKGEKRSKYPRCRPTPAACKGYKRRGDNLQKKKNEAHLPSKRGFKKAQKAAMMYSPAEEEAYLAGARGESDEQYRGDEKLLDAFYAGRRDPYSKRNRDSGDPRKARYSRRLEEDKIEEIEYNYIAASDATYDDGNAIDFMLEFWDDVVVEAEYQGRKVKLNKPMRGDVKKFKVYVKDPKTGNIKKVNFGDPNMRIKKSNPKRRKSFRARHNCDNPGPKTKARYWSCRKW